MARLFWDVTCWISSATRQMFGSLHLLPTRTRRFTSTTTTRRSAPLYPLQPSPNHLPAWNHRARPHLQLPEIRVPHSAYPNLRLFDSVYPPHGHFSNNNTTTTMAPTSFASAAAGSNSSSQRAETSADWYVLLFLTFCSLHAPMNPPSSRALESRLRLCNYTPYCLYIFTTLAFIMTKSTPSVPDTYQIYRARRTNGATQTFRRPSHATSLSGSTAHSASRDALTSQNASSSGVYVPPHAQPGRNGSYAEGRFSREQLTQLFKTQRENEELTDGLSNLSMGVLEQHAANGVSSASWGRNHDHSRDAQSGVDQCWDRDGSIEPLSLRDLTDEEREVRSGILHMCS
jgi:hypothetical protein